MEGHPQAEAASLRPPCRRRAGTTLRAELDELEFSSINPFLTGDTDPNARSIPRDAACAAETRARAPHADGAEQLLDAEREAPVVIVHRGADGALTQDFVSRAFHGTPECLATKLVERKCLEGQGRHRPASRRRGCRQRSGTGRRQPQRFGARRSWDARAAATPRWSVRARGSGGDGAQPSGSRLGRRDKHCRDAAAGSSPSRHWSTLTVFPGTGWRAPQSSVSRWLGSAVLVAVERAALDARLLLFASYTLPLPPRSGALSRFPALPRSLQAAAGGRHARASPSAWMRSSAATRGGRSLGTRGGRGWKTAVADIIGARRAWTVAMISSVPSLAGRCWWCRGWRDRAGVG